MERLGSALLARTETLQREKTMSLFLLANTARALASKFIQLLPKAKLKFSVTRVGSMGSTLLELSDPLEAKVSIIAGL